jgi:hypothetical protein
MNINERKLRRLFADEGLRVLEIRCRKHWVAKVARDDGRPFSVAVSCSPSDLISWELHPVAETRRASIAPA